MTGFLIIGFVGVSLEMKRAARLRAALFLSEKFF